MKEKKYTIFYSWQSDDKKSKNHIGKCLKRVVDLLGKDLTVEGRPVLDDSTKGKMGAVEIPATIMSKIDSCDVFVADLSFIGEYSKRKLVNQNVIYELGYMIGKRTDSRVVILFNSDSGEIKDLPFDISHRRIMSFSIQDDKGGEKLINGLSDLFSGYIRSDESPKRLLRNNTLDLDNEELDIMRLFKTMDDNKHIMVIRTLSGDSIYPASSVYDKRLLSKISAEQTPQKLIANLDGLVDKNILKVYMGGRNTMNYKLKKAGYDIIEKI